MNGFKRFIGNKNTVTIIGVIAIIAVIYFGYTFAVNRGTESLTVPYAKVAIQPRTKITEDMIGYTKVLKSTLQGNVITNEKKVKDFYTNVNTLIPKGSLFYSDAVISYDNLPDASLMEIPEGEIAFSLAVDINSTYGNSIYPGNYIDVYLKALDDNGKLILGKIMENVKVLAVKDKAGNHVFENTEESRIPAMLIFSLKEDKYVLLKKATFLYNAATKVELIPVPTNEALKSIPGATNITSAQAAEFITARTLSFEQNGELLEEE